MLLKQTLFVRALGAARIPLIFYVAPRVLTLDDDGCAVKIPLIYRNRNHLGSMYFGALCIGADLAGGLNAAWTSFRHHKRVKLVFKDFKADFLKRPEGDVVFRCTQGREIAAAVAQADATGERLTFPVKITATVPEQLGDEPVSHFTLGLSLKRK